MLSGENYLGSYIELPKCNWDKLAEKLDIDEGEFMNFSGKPNIYFSNYNDINLYRDDLVIEVFKLDDKLKAKAEKLFLKEHSKTIEKLRKHFNKDIPIKFGLISYII